MENDKVKRILWISIIIIVIIVSIQVEEKNYNEKLQRDIEDYSREIKYEPEWVKHCNPSANPVQKVMPSEENYKFSEDEKFEDDTFNFDSELDGFTPEDLDMDPDDPEVEEWYDFNSD